MHRTNNKLFPFFAASISTLRISLFSKHHPTTGFLSVCKIAGAPSWLLTQCEFQFQGQELVEMYLN